MKQEERIQISRELIIEAATREFGKYGFSGASVNRFCEAYHITKGRLYHHFTNKEEIFEACVMAAFDKLFACSKAFRYAPEQSLLEKMCGFFECIQVFFKENPYYLIMIFVAGRRPPEALRERMIQYVLAYREITKEVLGAIIASDPMGKHISAETLTGIYFVTVYHLLSTYTYPNWDPEGDMSEVRAENSRQVLEILRMFLYGALPRD